MNLDIGECLTLIAQCEMLSHGSTQAFNASGGHNAEKENPLPPGEANPPHLWLRAELDKANTQPQVDKVAQKAQECLAKARYAPDRRLVKGTFEWRQAIARDDRTAKEIARIRDVSIRTVYNIRKEFKSAA